MTTDDYHLDMKSVGTAELKAHLSKHLRMVRAGATITVLDRRQPVARIVPIRDAGSDLVVRTAMGSLRDLGLPSPARHEGDAVDELLKDREERL